MRSTFFKSITFRVTFWVSLFVVAIVSIHIYLMSPERRFFEQKMHESERMALIVETHLLAEMSGGDPDNIQNHMALLPELEGVRRVEIFGTDMGHRDLRELSFERSDQQRALQRPGRADVYGLPHAQSVQVGSCVAGQPLRGGRGFAHVHDQPERD
jgi:hypothetical protein